MLKFEEAEFRFLIAGTYCDKAGRANYILRTIRVNTSCKTLHRPVPPFIIVRVMSDIRHKLMVYGSKVKVNHKTFHVVNKLK